MIGMIVSGFVHGNVYALVTVGISLIFGVTGVVNFAQGSIIGLGTIFDRWFIGMRGWSWWLALLAVAVPSALIDWVINLTTVRPLIKAPPVAALLVIFAASMMLDNLSQILLKTDARECPALLPTDGLPVGGVRLGTSDTAASGFTITAMSALWVWLRFGREDMAMQVTATGPDAACQMGVPVTRVQNLSFLLTPYPGGVGGIFSGMYAGVTSPYPAFFTGAVGFIVITVGDLGSVVGAVAGGFMISLLEALGIYQFDGSFRDLFIFGIFPLVLLLRSHGLFGSRHTVSSEPMTGTFLGAGRPPRLTWWRWVLPTLVADLTVPLLGGPVLSSVGTQVAIYAIIAVPMTSLARSTRQVSLGQAASVAIGAYVSAPLTMRLDLPSLVALLLAGMIAAVPVTLMILPVWRLGGHYVFMAALALGCTMLPAIRGWSATIKGVYGLSDIPAPEILGLWPLVTEDHHQLDLMVLAVTLVVAFRVCSSHLGNVLAAVGSDETASRSLGLCTRGYKALAYALAVSFAGVAGVLLAHQHNYLDPAAFTAQMSVLVLMIAVLGGINFPFGAVLGSLALVGLPEALRPTPDVRILPYGIVVTAIIRFLPRGLRMRNT